MNRQPLRESATFCGLMAMLLAFLAVAVMGLSAVGIGMGLLFSSRALDALSGSNPPPYDWRVTPSEAFIAAVVLAICAVMIGLIVVNELELAAVRWVFLLAGVAFLVNSFRKAVEFRLSTKERGTS
jgi:hypothetical protein